MQLSDIRAEVFAKGFDPALFGNTRVNSFINDGYMSICRKVDYYVDEKTLDFTTLAGTIQYALPTDWGKLRELYDTTRNVAIRPVGIRQIDVSDSTLTGPPSAYTLGGTHIRVWPIPDGVYSLELRYWAMPPLLVADGDVPTLPTDYHNLLWVYATWQCYESEDDPNMGQYWQNRFKTGLAEFAADQKFPTTEYPTVARGMWEADEPLSNRGWSLWGWV